MKITTTYLAVIAALGGILFCVQAKAVATDGTVINISEPSEGSDIWAFNVTGPGFILGDPNHPYLQTSRPDYFHVDGSLASDVPGDISGTRYAVLLEPNSTEPSDVIKFFGLNGTGQNPDYISLDFWSDDDQDFASALADARAAGFQALEETGSLQPVGSGILFNDNSGKLQINVNSDALEVPDSGSTVALLGLAMASIAAVSRRSMKS